MQYKPAPVTWRVVSPSSCVTEHRASALLAPTQGYHLFQVASLPSVFLHPKASVSGSDSGFYSCLGVGQPGHSVTSPSPPVRCEWVQNRAWGHALPETQWAFPSQALVSQVLFSRKAKHNTVPSGFSNLATTILLSGERHPVPFSISEAVLPRDRR
jgi:hypothetical protein